MDTTVGTSSRGKQSLPCRKDAIYYAAVACRALHSARDLNSTSINSNSRLRLASDEDSTRLKPEQLDPGLFLVDS